MSGTMTGNRGLYMTACESSQYRNQIDQWINENKSNLEISKKLSQLGEKISDKSVAKYRKYRDEQIQNALMENPLYQAQMQTANDTLVTEVGKIKQVDIMAHLTETLEQCADLLDKAKLDDVRIKNVQDLRYVQMTMLETLKLYTDTTMKAQAFKKIEEDPTLLKPTVNVNVKQALLDMLGGVSEDVRYKLIDRIRGSLGDDVQGGLQGNNGADGSSDLGGEQSNTEG